MFFLLSGYSSNSFSNRCIPGFGIKYCFPNNLQPVVDPNSNFKRNLFLFLSKGDKKVINEFNSNKLIYDKKLSIVWNETLSNSAIYFNKK